MCSGRVGQDVVDEVLASFAGVNFEGLNDHSGEIRLNAFDVSYHYIAAQLGDKRVRKVFTTGPDASDRPVSPQLLRLEKELQDLRGRLMSQRKLKCVISGA